MYLISKVWLMDFVAQRCDVLTVNYFVDVNLFIIFLITQKREPSVSPDSKFKKLHRNI